MTTKTTQSETIVWHLFEAEKPKENGWYLCEEYRRDTTTTHFWDVERRLFITMKPDNPFAWAEMPTGWKE